MTDDPLEEIRKRFNGEYAEGHQKLRIAAEEIDDVRDRLEYGDLDLSSELAEKMDSVLAKMQTTMRELAINEEVMADAE